MTVILGINGYSARTPSRGATHNTSAAIVHDGKLIAALDEERLSRIKGDRDYPFKTINYLTSDFPWPDHIAMAGMARSKLFTSLWRQYANTLRMPLRPDFRQYLRSRLFDLPIRTIAERLRPRSVPEALVSLPKSEIRHHHAHAASAYYCCPWPEEKVLVLTLDGFGDAQCGTCWVGKKGRMTLQSELPFMHSIGLLYTAVTYHLGFKPVQHEGKIVGLASYGNPEPMHERLMKHISICHDGTFKFSPELIQLSNAPMRGSAKEIFEELTQGLSQEDIAAGIQRVTEQLVCHWIAHQCRKYDSGLLALAGGVFANVKLNQRILELDEVENIYIHPNMGDGGLAAGAALAVWADMQPDFRPRLLEHCYLGPSISDTEAKNALDNAGLKHQTPKNLAETVANTLVQGKVVARAAGPMEYGPRALGNRSILASCDDPSINQWLNERLQRTEFMPFAPIIMEEYAADYFPAWKPEHVAARFMTITYDASELAKKNIPAAIHVDGTARPQVLRKQDNPEVYDILAAYHTRTGIPALINTSFNMHEEPIVCTAEEAVRAFQLGHLDALICGNRLAVRNHA